MSTTTDKPVRSRHHEPARQLGPAPRRRGDLLAGALWYCASTAPGAVADPDQLPGNLLWHPARVPGTAAGALREAGLFSVGDEHDFDAEDWWFACRLPAGSSGRHVLLLDGIATSADVWLDGRHVAQSTSMFLRHEVPLSRVVAGSRLVIRCAALAPMLGRRAARGRWRSGLVERQALRNWRTALLGRVPVWPSTGAPVGPWRPVRIEPLDPGRLDDLWLAAGYDDGAGSLQLRAHLAGDPDGSPPAGGEEAVLACAGQEAAVALSPDGDGWLLEASMVLPGVEPWWPRPHGEPVRHDVQLALGERVVRLGRVGFRGLELDRSDGAFALSCNGTRLFCRGVSWWPVDPVSLAAPSEETRAQLGDIADTGFNLVRVSGWTTYENDAFFEACDELGLLVWQDLMFGTLDLPEDPEFAALVGREVEQLLAPLARHPSLALVCGSNEGESQPAMLGIPASERRLEVVERILPSAAERLVPGVPVVSSSPTGDVQPFFPGSGSSHYFGVGHYRRPLSDARLAAVRFASECLALSIPPERRSTDHLAGHVHTVRDPRWLAAVPRDAGSSWDFADVTDHYLRELFGADPQSLRATDPERYLALQRATCAVLVERVLGEWRRPGSTCAGAVLTSWRDQLLGPGFGLIDSLGTPKSTWYAARRVLAPLACLASDEGLNGLAVHLVNDRPEPVEARLVVARFAESERVLESGERLVALAGRGSLSCRADELFPGFRDLTYAYRFGPPEHDVVGLRLELDGSPVAQLAHLPLGLACPVEPDLGVSATLRPAGGGAWWLEVTARRFAQLVDVDAEGYRSEDSWFDILPGWERRLLLRPDRPPSPGDDAPTPRVLVRPLNCSAPTRALPAGEQR